MRFALGIHYKGCRYHGWQKQPELKTVQGELETALAYVADQPIEVVCAGRTDTAVHATGQVVHFDSPVMRSDKAWIFGTNTRLPSDIAVHWAKQVPDHFHARFGARARHYRYLIYNCRARPASFNEQISWYYLPLNEKAMHQSAQLLLGEHDFSAYRSVGCQSKSVHRCVHSIRVFRQRHVIMIDIKANAFLQHMVRNIVGVLLAVGEGKADVDWSKQVLDSRDRRLGGVTAPPYGLYLTQVDYPENYAIPAGISPSLVM